MAKESGEFDELLKIFSDATKDDAPDESKMSTRQNDSGKIERTSLSAFPSEMSCTQAFDELVSCFSIGGQIRNYYRYGELGQCLNQKEAFKLCLKTKLQSKEQKEAKVQEFYREKLAKERLRGSSEDIWKLRNKKLEDPFYESH